MNNHNIPTYLASSLNDYARFKITKGNIEPREDGLRLDTGYSNGILLYAEEGANASNNLIQGNLAYTNPSSGIYVTGYADKSRILDKEYKSWIQK